MRYLLAIFLPPIAVFVHSSAAQTILNILLTMLFWFPGVIHALIIVHSHPDDSHVDQAINSIKGGNRQ